MNKEIEEEVEELLLGSDYDDKYDDLNVSVPVSPSLFVDIVFCIDVTSSMAPILNHVKNLTLDFYDDVMANMSRKYGSKQLRVKVIAFRDYYCDGPYAMEESDFFTLPEEKSKFHNFVSSLEADGGGDEPENALEAIALAIKSDWVRAVSDNERARNIIVVFTDASAHPFEKAQNEATRYYPDNMLTSLIDLKDAWDRMDPRSKRLIIYAPGDSYPWNEIIDLSRVKMFSIEPAKGGKELDQKILLSDVAGEICCD